MQQQNSYIDFRKQRELGELITDTFKFLRRNFKAISLILIKIVGIPFILFVAASVYQSTSTLGSTFFDVSDPLGMYTTNVIVSTLLLYLCIFIYISFLYGGMMAIIQSYISNKGDIIESEVMEIVKAKTGQIVLTGLGKFAILFIGFMLCFFPGVYLSAPLFLVFPVLIFERKGASDAISRTFQLIKDEWWMTFIFAVIMGVIWYIISLIFSLPAAIYMWIKMFTAVQENSLSDPSSMFDLGTIIITIIASALQYLAYLFMPISAALVYFHLHERKHQSGTMERIDNLGN